VNGPFVYPKVYPSGFFRPRCVGEIGTKPFRRCDNCVARSGWLSAETPKRTGIHQQSLACVRGLIWRALVTAGCCRCVDRFSLPSPPQQTQHAEAGGTRGGNRLLRRRADRIRVAKRMIIDGNMPSPEEAHQQLRQR
jgi:hypothetical protein